MPMTDTVPDVPEQVLLQPYNRNITCLHILPQTHLSWCHLHLTPTHTCRLPQDHQPQLDESSLGSQLTHIQLQSAGEMSTSVSAKTQATKSVFLTKNSIDKHWFLSVICQSYRGSISIMLWPLFKKSCLPKNCNNSTSKSHSQTLRLRECFLALSHHQLYNLFHRAKQEGTFNTWKRN